MGYRMATGMCLRMAMRSVAVMAAAVLLAGVVAPREALADPGKTLLLCYPGGNVNSRDAKPATDKMLRVLERLGGWSADTFGSSFTSSVKECETLMESGPEFAFVSLGLFLEDGGKTLVPLVQPRIDKKTTEVFRVLVRKDGPSSMADLKGKTIGGTALAEPDFLMKVVFKGRFAASDFVFEPTKRALRALRDLRAGKLDAVLVTAQQYKALGSLPFADEFTVAFSSDPIPLMPLVANRKKSTPDERKRFTKAMSKFCGTDDGKQFCELFGIDSFTPASDETFEPMRALWK